MTVTTDIFFPCKWWHSLPMWIIHNYCILVSRCKMHGIMHEYCLLCRTLLCTAMSKPWLSLTCSSLLLHLLHEVEFNLALKTDWLMNTLYRRAKQLSKLTTAAQFPDRDRCTVLVLSESNYVCPSCSMNTHFSPTRTVLAVPGGVAHISACNQWSGPR